MNKQLLTNHIQDYLQYISDNPDEHAKDSAYRAERVTYYQAYTKKKILDMTKDEFAEYIAKLWAMLIWGNKKYVIDKLISDNGFDTLKKELAELVWGKSKVSVRWDHFRQNIKGMGPAMISEILSHVHPETCMLWNRRAHAGLKYLGVTNLPRYNYQVTGKKYEELSALAGSIAEEMKKQGMKSPNLLTVDYFIWQELQGDVVLQHLHDNEDKPDVKKAAVASDKPTADFVHNEIRDKVAEIGRWLGLDGQTEIKVSQGSKVDAVWESTIGNMGRIIYVFEVQTKGSIDSLIVNLSKSLKNPAVQSVVAVSDSHQIEKIKKHAADMPNLGGKLKYWDYEDVLRVHEALETVNESINSLGLVPQGFE